MEVTECRYRGRVIGWLVEGPDGFLKYITDGPGAAFHVAWLSMVRTMK